MLKTFSIGGVHPHENKLSAHQPIIKAEVPAKAVILLGQHIGAPAKPIVAKGDVVKVGTKIAEPGGFVSAAIHSSVSGKVAKSIRLSMPVVIRNLPSLLMWTVMNGKKVLIAPKRW